MNHFVIKKIFFNGAIKLIEPKSFMDNRGSFLESYNYNYFKNCLNIYESFVQDNISYSKYKSTIRGMHLQSKPYSQSKLILVINGSIIDYFVDLRKSSQTFGQYNSIKLESKKRQLLYIKKGFAHGFKTLQDDTMIMYKVSNFYSPKNEITLDYLDKEININWKVNNTKTHISKKDLDGKSLKLIKKFL